MIERIQRSGPPKDSLLAAQRKVEEERRAALPPTVEEIARAKKDAEVRIPGPDAAK